MMRILPLLVVALPLSGQSYPHLDLSGPWRTKLADDATYARADFDDSGWDTFTLPAPGRDPEPGRYRWLRRSFILEPGTRTDELVLTIGGFRPSYEVFVNGIKVGDSGGETEMPGAKLYPVPPGVCREGEANVVALRGRPPYRSALPGGAQPLPNAGPFLLSGRVNAPVWVLEADRERRLRFLTPAIAAALLYFVLAILLFLAWLGSRRERVLVALGGFLGLEALARFTEYSYVFSGENRGFVLPIVVLNAGPIVFAVLDQLGIHWRKAGPAGVLVCAALGANLAGGTVALYGILLFGASRLATGWRRLRGRRAITVALLLVLALFTTRVPGAALAGRMSLYVAGYYFRTFDTTVLVLAVVLVILLIRRLIEDRREKQRLAAELEAARAVQQLMLPDSGARTAAFALEAVYEPANEVGGDFYWTRTDRDQALIVAAGDVSGKGLKAAMLVSVAIGILRNEKSNSPGALLAALNDGLAGHTGGGFVTCCCARFDADDRVTIANAGHPPPYCDRQEVAVEAGLPLGIVPGATYEETAVSGECFTFVSDGVVEAENSQRELFGFERTRAISLSSAREIAEAAKAWGQNDDITVVTVRRTNG